MPVLGGVGTRFVAAEPKSARRPSDETDAPTLPAVACWPASFCETRLKLAVTRSYRKTSAAPLRSFPTSLSSDEWKPTQRPSAEIDGARLSVPANVWVLYDANTV